MQGRQPANTAGILRRPSARQRVVAAVIALSIVALFGGLWGLQRSGFDVGRLFNPCGFRQRTGLPCPACGMTTAVQAFARGDMVASFTAQPAAAFLCGLLVVIAFLALLTGVGGVYLTVFDRFFYEVKVRYLIAGLLVILAAGWAVTLARALAAQRAG